MTDPIQWREFLAQRERQWKTGYSARTLAHCWHDPDCQRGLPPELREAFDRVEPLRGMDVLIALPEHKVALSGGRRASQTDIWFLGRTESDLVSVAVEGKVGEDFGPAVFDWINDANERSGKTERLAALTGLLNLNDVNLNAIRYQLLHRTASALLEARRFHTRLAVMLVHAFGNDSHFDQFSAFARLMGADAPAPGIFFARNLSNIELYLGWVRGADRWLEA